MGPLPLGKVVATSGALKLLLEGGEDPFDYLARHATGDWGDLCAFDRRQNERALRKRVARLLLLRHPSGEGLDHHRGR
jgi:hypothetical protein